MCISATQSVRSRAPDACMLSSMHSSMMLGLTAWRHGRPGRDSRQAPAQTQYCHLQPQRIASLRHVIQSPARVLGVVFPPFKSRLHNFLSRRCRHFAVTSNWPEDDQVANSNELNGNQRGTAKFNAGVFRQRESIRAHSLMKSERLSTLSHYYSFSPRLNLVLTIRRFSDSSKRLPTDRRIADDIFPCQP